MNYYIDLFSPETAQAFERSKRSVTGFRISRKTYVKNKKIGPGDKFICYVTRLQRFVGVLKIVGKDFVDEAPLFQDEGDPFVLRFKVEPLVWLPLEKAIPIHEDFVWRKLSFTKKLSKNSIRWTGMVRSSPVHWPKKDCDFLEEIIFQQSKKMIIYPFPKNYLGKGKSNFVTTTGKAPKISSNNVTKKNFNEILKVDQSTLRHFEQHQLRAPDKIKIRDIIKKVKGVEWAIPKFQRYFDWKKNNISELLESVLHGYYVGSFLLWEIDSRREPIIGTMPIQGAVGDTKYSREIILDGQQRITSLFYAIRAPNFSLEGAGYQIFFYIDFKALLKNQDDNVIFFKKEKIVADEAVRNWYFPLFETEDFDQWIDKFEEAQERMGYPKKELKDIRNWVRDRLRYFWDGYEIPYVALPSSMELDQVVEIFERINTRGKRLDVFDLLIARLYSEKIDLRELWDKALEDFPLIRKYNSVGVPMGVYIFNTLMLLHDKNSSTKKKDMINIVERVYVDNISGFKSDWSNAVKYIDSALSKLEGLRDGFGVVEPGVVPYNPTIPVIAALLSRIEASQNSADANNKLSRWYWSTVFSGAYEASADTRMTSDYRDMRIWFEDDEKLPQAVKEVVQKIDLLDLENNASSSGAAYRGVLSLIALAGGIDFANDLRIENSEDLDLDHIFPKSSFNKERYIDSILNTTWMSRETNQKIKRAQNPSAFFKQILHDKYRDDKDKFSRVLQSHLISKAAYAALINDDFNLFLKERRDAIVKKVFEMTQIKTDSRPINVISPSTPFTNKLMMQRALESCRGHLFWIDKYFSKQGLELLSEVTRTNRALEYIRILSGYDNLDENFKRDFKNFKAELKNYGISVEMRVIIDKKISRNIHDRWILSDNIKYNVPSVDTAARGQYSEIKETSVQLPIEDWWAGGLEIVASWDKISKEIDKFVRKT